MAGPRVRRPSIALPRQGGRPAGVGDSPAHRAGEALVTIEHDEYGVGDPVRMHSHLFAQMMQVLDLNPAHGADRNAAPPRRSPR